MTVQGAGMGLVRYTGRAREGQTGCEATEWESETSVRCQVSEGGRGTRRAVAARTSGGGGTTQVGDEVKMASALQSKISLQPQMAFNSFFILY